MEETRNGYKLSTGREFYANCGLVSVMVNRDGAFLVREGYDGVVYGAGVEDGADPEDLWTNEERQELADFMIERWTTYKKAAGG